MLPPTRREQRLWFFPLQQNLHSTNKTVFNQNQEYYVTKTNLKPFYIHYKKRHRTFSVVFFPAKPNNCLPDRFRYLLKIRRSNFVLFFMLITPRVKTCKFYLCIFMSFETTPANRHHSIPYHLKVKKLCLSDTISCIVETFFVCSSPD